eukprot:gnl/MRDRNA2_/MRDRNA2_173119_c0_seq1.p1 gnl/MRDRNA2_/MRDRNA2_173119_c0~~gnl/MRDRNA2_/MRDRNA2_173119_c0_seq1.p1  ORF type:complete len:814 (-),score=122.68 gnl/MRDRNA2_/MRDRNA2_173119_c0_seq1:16-2457(-)
MRNRGRDDSRDNRGHGSASNAHRSEDNVILLPARVSSHKVARNGTSRGWQAAPGRSRSDRGRAARHQDSPARYRRGIDENKEAGHKLDRQRNYRSPEQPRRKRRSFERSMTREASEDERSLTTSRRRRNQNAEDYNRAVSQEDGVSRRRHRHITEDAPARLGTRDQVGRGRSRRLKRQSPEQRVTRLASEQKEAARREHSPSTEPASVSVAKLDSQHASAREATADTEKASAATAETEQAPTPVAEVESATDPLSDILGDLLQPSSSSANSSLFFSVDTLEEVAKAVAKSEADSKADAKASVADGAASSRKIEHSIPKEAESNTESSRMNSETDEKLDLQKAAEQAVEVVDESVESRKKMSRWEDSPMLLAASSYVPTESQVATQVLPDRNILGVSRVVVDPGQNHIQNYGVRNQTRNQMLTDPEIQEKIQLLNLELDAHDTAHQQVGWRKKGQICKFYMEGRCADPAELCIYAHSNEEMKVHTRMTQIEQLIIALQTPNPVNQYWDDMMHAQLVQELFVAKNRPPKQIKAQMCPFHMHGQCANGANCTYAHSEHEMNIHRQMYMATGQQMDRPTGLPGFRKVTMCKFHLAGRCLNGGSCSFAHDPSELQAAGGKSKAIMCKFHKESKCLNGAACNFAHSEEEMLSHRSATAENAVALQNIAANPDMQEYVQSLQLQLQQHEAIHARGWRQKVGMCFKYLEGRCKYSSENCNFAHSEDEVVYNQQMLQIENALKPIEARPKTSLKVAMCRFFLEGRCANTSNCQFAHDPSELDNISKPKATMCKFHAEGKCMNGTACPFAHHETELINYRGRR